MLVGGAMKLQVVTIAVTSLERSRPFYEETLGFERDIYYEPTRWQSYRIDGDGGFGITEEPSLQRSPSSDIINFVVRNIDALWARVQGHADIESELATTPWGAYKFVVRDPDGFRLGFVSDVDG
jgi:catechol 2,3-dioxygenase-like lactoylglutathione lyase family enzyme